MIGKKTPMRKCLGCGEMKDKKELVRIVRSSEGEISVDITGKKPGRGAYICRSEACLNAAVKARRLDRAFKCKLPEDIYGTLASELAGSSD